MTWMSIANQIILGLSTAAIYVLVSLGLTMIFGMMNVLNFTHGVLYALGAYFGYLLVKLTGSFWLAACDRTAPRRAHRHADRADLDSAARRSTAPNSVPRNLRAGTHHRADHSPGRGKRCLCGQPARPRSPRRSVSAHW